MNLEQQRSFDWITVLASVGAVIGNVSMAVTWPLGVALTAGLTFWIGHYLGWSNNA